MRIKIFEAKTMPEAMAQMRSVLGPEALLLHCQNTENGVAITGGIERKSSADLPSALPHSKILAFHNVPSAISAQLERHPHEQPAATQEIKPSPRLHDVPNLPSLPPKALAASASLAKSFADIFQFGSLSWDEPIVLVGPPGAGKTLSLVKLAVQLVRDGTPPLVINADHYRAAALPQLDAFTSLLNLDLIDAPTPYALAKALGEREAGMPVLIDSPGLDPFANDDAELLQALCDASEGSAALVLPAGLDPGESADLAEIFFELGARNLIVTKLDLTRRLGGVLAAAATGPYVITEGGVGPGAADGIASLTPNRLAQYFYRPHASLKIFESTAP